MSPDGRWRSFKIVAPLTPNREEEIVGGLKNALARGETLAKAKQSFLNAGYKPAEIDAAAQKMPAATPQIAKPVQAPIKPTTDHRPPTTEAQPLPAATTATPPKQKQHLSKKFIIILVSIGVSILIIAGILGWKWNAWFGA